MRRRSADGAVAADANLLMIRTSGLQADYGSINSGEEHFYAWKTLYPADDAGQAGKGRTLSAQERLVAGMLTRANLLQMLRTCTMGLLGGP